MITELKPNEVFVFGSNTAGIHGAGAALFAKNHFGAKQGKGFGHYGQSFAIPTKNHQIKTLSLEDIKFSVERFIEHAYLNPNLKFLVTEIGCGLAGYKPKDIAPLFKYMNQFKKLDNIVLPESFKQILKND